MAEYIEREAALVICEKEYQERIKMQDWCGDTVAWNIGHAIKAIPAADVAPVVHGRWYEVLHDEFSDACNDYIIWSTYGCSKCGNEVMKDFNYCPNCGARMDGE